MSDTAPPRPPKSPPLAFAKTSNDALIPPIHVADSDHHPTTTTTFPSSATAPFDSSAFRPDHSTDTMGRSLEQQLFLAIDQKQKAIDHLHTAFHAERQAWSLERAGLKQYILRLEAQLNSGHHYSPAKSPLHSPSSGNAMLSPQARACTTNTLPTISEDENIMPLSMRREGAPQSIDISVLSEHTQRRPSVSFLSSDELIVEEDPIDLLPTRQTLSPPPPANNLMHAGHTPVRTHSRPPTPPPAKMDLDGIEDTPTRHNTAINNFLTRTNDEDEEKALSGPLNMPELPNQPGENNFTIEALTTRLEKLGSDPVSRRPSVYNQPSPGLASPIDKPRSKGISPSDTTRNAEPPASAAGVRSDGSSTAMSPSNSGGSMLSPQEVAESKIHSEFEQGGIRLKKKPSLNFGAAFGTLAGASFGGAAAAAAVGRKMS